jgi:hypothetical protein
MMNGEPNCCGMPIRSSGETAPPEINQDERHSKRRHKCPKRIP